MLVCKILVVIILASPKGEVSYVLHVLKVEL